MRNFFNQIIVFSIKRFSQICPSSTKTNKTENYFNRMP